MAGGRWSEFDEFEDQPSNPSRLVRPLIWILSLLVVLVLIAIPILRAIDYSRDQSTEQAAGEARAYVAGGFALAALEQRSTHRAEQWAIPGLHDSIDAVVLDLQLRNSRELAGAKAKVTRQACGGVVPGGPTAECFLASLVRPDGYVVTRVPLVVAIVDGQARVVQVGTSA